MSKKEEFKTFVSKHPELVNYVNKEKKNSHQYEYVKDMARFIRDL